MLDALQGSLLIQRALNFRKTLKETDQNGRKFPEAFGVHKAVEGPYVNALLLQRVQTGDYFNLSSA